MPSTSVSALCLEKAADLQIDTDAALHNRQEKRVSHAYLSCRLLYTKGEIGMTTTTAADDKETVREVLAEYCFRLDDGPFDEMAALFTEDGTWDTAFGSATGRAAIAELARSMRSGAPQPRPRGIHLVTNIAIRIEGSRATVRSNWIVAQNSPEGPKIGSGGGYVDDMVKTDSGWRFRTRKIDRFIVP